jgi:4-hydroxybenzoate polyprenyltransferase
MEVRKENNEMLDKKDPLGTAATLFVFSLFGLAILYLSVITFPFSCGLWFLIAVCAVGALILRRMEKTNE